VQLFHDDVWEKGTPHQLALEKRSCGWNTLGGNMMCIRDITPFAFH
jgi:hypothetical protein